MIGEREHGVVAQLVGKLEIGRLDDVGGDGQHGGRELLEKGQVVLVHVVEGALDGGERKLARFFVDSEGDALAKGDDAAAFGIHAHDGVVIDSLCYFHGIPHHNWQTRRRVPARNGLLLDHASRGSRTQACYARLVLKRFKWFSKRATRRRSVNG